MHELSTRTCKWHPTVIQIVPKTAHLVKVHGEAIILKRFQQVIGEDLVVNWPELVESSEPMDHHVKIKVGRRYASTLWLQGVFEACWVVN
ncbi:MAG: hypothetical protein ACO3PX_17160 [bacterium]